MSDKAEALVTIYTTAFLTIVSTITSPFVEAFITAWIAWFPFVRGAVGVSIYTVDMWDHLQLYSHVVWSQLQALIKHRRRRLRKEQEKGTAYDLPFELEKQESTPQATVVPSCLADVPLPQFPDLDTSEFHKQRKIVRSGCIIDQRSYTPPSLLSYLVWLVWHLYTPYSQLSWFVIHYHRDTTNPGLFLARGTAVGVVLVAMSVDYKTRIIRDAVRRAGGLSGATIGIMMCIWSLIARLLLLALAVADFILAIMRNQLHTSGWPNQVAVPIFAIFTVGWGFASFAFVKGRDHDPYGGRERSEQSSRDMKSLSLPEGSGPPQRRGTFDGFDRPHDSMAYRFIVPIYMRPFAGVFFACFTCALALIIFGSADNTNGLSFPAYVECSSVWERIQHLVY